jgi:hypothetical protein
LFERLDEEDRQMTQAVIDFADGKMEDGKGWNVEFELQKLGRSAFCGFGYALHSTVGCGGFRKE